MKGAVDCTLGRNGPAYVFDIETDGFLGELTKVHCMVLVDIRTGEPMSFADQPGHRPISEGLDLLSEAALLVGHNVIEYDIPALRRVFPKWEYSGLVRDTMVSARFIWPKDKLKDGDFRKFQQGKFPGAHIGAYTLKAFGYRLGNYKDEYNGGWSSWNQEMHDYMVQDGNVTLHLWRRICDEEWPQEVFDLEHDAARIVARQMRRGIAFNEAKAHVLAAKLAGERARLERILVDTFPPLKIETPFTPKSSNSKLGYVKGVPTIKVKWKEFNPASRPHIAERLQMLGWQPEEFTDTGIPKMDETIMAELPYAEAKPLVDFFVVEKRLGQLAEGKEAWLKHVRNGRIHGRVNSNGAVTGRMTHSSPNLAQIPANHSPYGEECRDLFEARDGYVMVGADADALELRCLAHFMACFDNGAYVEVVLRGDKSKGTDIHSVNCRALGMDPKGHYTIDGKTTTGRDIAKTWFYAFIYGAGDEKLGRIMGASKDRRKADGRRSRETFLAALPALKELVDAVKAAAKRGYLIGLDGRRVYVRSDHAALNTLLQSAGGLVMKKALAILDEGLQLDDLLIPGRDYEFVANVHDEWQIEARPEWAEVVGTRAASAIHKAGAFFNFRCPLDGQFKIGVSWRETH